MSRLRAGSATPGPADQGGQATVELALLLPLVLALVMLVVQIGLVVRAQVLVVQAAREAARSAAVGGDAASARAAGLQATPLGNGPLSVTVTLADSGGAVVGSAHYPVDVGLAALGMTRRIVVTGRVAMRREY